MELSVVICTRNPRSHYLRRVLDALRNQTLPMSQWELLLVDNASQQALTPNTWDLSWQPNAHHIRENELGIVAARVRGMQECSADVLVFVDDDNVLDPNYLQEAVKIKHEWPQLGVWGGSIVPEFEVVPAVYLREYLHFLALREVDAPRWSNLATCNAAEPWGAGMCVRNVVAKEYCRLAAISTTHLGGRGEDVEICYTACGLGLGMGLFPKLKLTHLIPKERIDEGYLVRHVEGIHTALHLIGFKWHGVIPSSPFSVRGLLRLCKHIALKRGVYRRMYLADIRARRRAREIILSGQEKNRERFKILRRV